MPDDFEFIDGLVELARLCDEHGLEHMDSEAEACKTHVFVDRDGDPHECWEADGNGRINVTIAMTPEQAVTMPSLRKLDFLADVYFQFAVRTLDDNDKLCELVQDMWRDLRAHGHKVANLLDARYLHRMNELGIETGDE